MIEQPMALREHLECGGGRRSSVGAGSEGGGCKGREHDGVVRGF